MTAAASAKIAAWREIEKAWHHQQHPWLAAAVWRHISISAT